MKGLISFVGIILIAAGVGSYFYNKVDYTDKKTVAQIGSVELTASTQESVAIPPMASGAAVLVGLVLVVVGFRKKK